MLLSLNHGAITEQMVEEKYRNKSQLEIEQKHRKEYKNISVN